MRTIQRDKNVWLVCLAAIVLSLLVAACNKTCHCYGYDGSHHYFTPEEVDAATDESCSSMIYFAGNRLYSICEWDY